MLRAVYLRSGPVLLSTCLYVCLEAVDCVRHANSIVSHLVFHKKLWIQNSVLETCIIPAAWDMPHPGRAEVKPRPRLSAAGSVFHTISAHLHLVLRSCCLRVDMKRRRVLLTLATLDCRAPLTVRIHIATGTAQTKEYNIHTYVYLFTCNSIGLYIHVFRDHVYIVTYNLRRAHQPGLTAATCRLTL